MESDLPRRGGVVGGGEWLNQPVQLKPFVSPFPAALVQPLKIEATQTPAFSASKAFKDKVKGA